MSTSMIGGPFNAYGSIVQGGMTSDSLNNQAGLADANADEAERQGQYNATKQGLVSAQKIGTSVASYGANGVTQSSGSVENVIGASNANAEMDRLNILHGADVKALNYHNQALLDRFGANSAKLAGYWGAAGAITGGAISGLSQSNQGARSGSDSADADPGSAGAGGHSFDYDSAGEGAGLEGASAGEGEIGAAAIA